MHKVLKGILFGSAVPSKGGQNGCVRGKQFPGNRLIPGVGGRKRVVALCIAVSLWPRC